MPVSFTCFLTLMLESYQDRIYPALIKLGFTIEPIVSVASSTVGKINPSDRASAIISFKVLSNDLTVSSTDIMDVFKKVLNQLQMSFFSVIIVGPSTFTWLGSNIIIPQEKNIPELPPVKTDKSSLN